MQAVTARKLPPIIFHWKKELTFLPSHSRPRNSPKPCGKDWIHGSLKPGLAMHLGRSRRLANFKTKNSHSVPQLRKESLLISFVRWGVLLSVGQHVCPLSE